MQKHQPLRTALMLVLGAVLFLAGYGVSQFFGYAKIARGLAQFRAENGGFV